MAGVDGVVGGKAIVRLLVLLEGDGIVINSS